MVRHRVDVEEHSAGNMRREMVVFRQRQHARHLERRIDNLDVRIGDMRGEPVSGDKRIVGGGHDAKSFQHSSWPGASRPSTSYLECVVARTWMPGTSPGMTVTGAEA